MEIESSKFQNGMSEIDDEEEDIENIERLAEGLANTHNGGNHHNEKEKKKKFSKKTNRFHELNYFLNTIPTETKKMTRDEKKAVEYQKMFDKMEEKSNKKKKSFKNERKKIKIGNDSENGSIPNIKGKLDLEVSSHEEEKIKESSSYAEVGSKTLSKFQPESLPQRIKAPDTQINPSFNLESHDNLFYYLYYYVKNERKAIEEIKEKEFNGEQVSSFSLHGKPKKINENEEIAAGGIPKRIHKIDEIVFQKTKFIQDSIRRKFKENMDKMNCTMEKDVLVRDFSKKYINKEEIDNLLEKEFSYY